MTEDEVVVRRLVEQFGMPYGLLEKCLYHRLCTRYITQVVTLKEACRHII